MNYNELAQQIYAQNKAVGWWDNPDRCLFECLQLVSTEVSEATEAERKDLNDDHLPHRKGGEAELADSLIRVLDIGGRLGLVYQEKDRPNYAYTYGTQSVGALHLAVNRDIIELANDLASHSPAVSGAYSRLIDTLDMVAGELGYALHDVVFEKLAYNKTRADHKREARAKTNGKKF